MASPGTMVNSGLKSEPTQLALALDHAESLAREDFLAGPSNDAALGLIERWPDWPSRAVLLRGPEGSGKSHLAAIWARESGARTLSPRVLEGAEVPVALATGALVLENLAEGGFDEAAHRGGRSRLAASGVAGGGADGAGRRAVPCRPGQAVR